jgi:hypothetical protein
VEIDLIMGTRKRGRDTGLSAPYASASLTAVGAKHASSRRTRTHGIIPHGSVAKRSRPVGRKVLRSKVRISVAPPTSSVTAMRSSATPVATMRAPLGRRAVASTSGPALPPDVKRR